MSRFHFQLETLLRIREQACEKALATYARALHARVLAESNLLQEEQALGRLQDTVVDARAGGMRGPFLHSYNDGILVAEEKLKRLQQSCEALRKEETRCREDYLARKREVDGLLRLKDKRMLDHRKLELKKEELANERPGLCRAPFLPRDSLGTHVT